MERSQSSRADCAVHFSCQMGSLELMLYALQSSRPQSFSYDFLSSSFLSLPLEFASEPPASLFINVILLGGRIQKGRHLCTYLYDQVIIAKGGSGEERPLLAALEEPLPGSVRVSVCSRAAAGGFSLALTLPTLKMTSWVTLKEN